MSPVGNPDYQGIFIFWDHLKLILWFTVKVLFLSPPKRWLRSLLKEDKSILVPILRLRLLPFLHSPQPGPTVWAQPQSILGIFPEPSLVTQALSLPSLTELVTRIFLQSTTLSGAYNPWPCYLRRPRKNPLTNKVTWVKLNPCWLIGLSERLSAWSPFCPGCLWQ